MLKPVLILADPGDAHALVVAARLKQRHGRQAFIWDPSRFPRIDALTGSLDAATYSISIESPAVGRQALSTFASIWWRRVRPASLSASLSDEDRAHCRAESTAMLLGALAASALPIYNDPSSERRAGRKPIQLSIAQKVGIDAPRTLMTNDPASVRDFYEQLDGRVVVKPFTARPAPLGGTQPLDKHDLDKLTLLNNAPAIFQERIGPARDVRVTVVGERIYAAESSSKMLDWRLDPSVTWKQHPLPEATERQVLDLMAGLGLALGSLDFRLTEAGQYYFFEVNPNGQFLFVEMADRRLPISSALADFLVQAPATRMPPT